MYYWMFYVIPPRELRNIIEREDNNMDWQTSYDMT
jgi:hypothetical protein